MPVIEDTSQEAALRLLRAAEPLNPPDDRIVIQTGWPSAAGFFVSDPLMTAYEADLLLPAPTMPNCRANNPCYSARCTPPAPPATGATSGTPGTWTPPGSAPPANPSSMAGITASPTTPWTFEQYIQTALAGTPGQTHWDGTAWVQGIVPWPTPALTSLSPSSVDITTTQTVTITGTGFSHETTITVGGVLETPTYISPTQLSFQQNPGRWSGTGSLPVMAANASKNSNMVSLVGT